MPLRPILGVYPGLKYLNINNEFDEDLAEFIKCSAVLETLILDPVNDSRLQEVFNAVAHHPQLRVVDGLPIHTRWIKALSASFPNESRPWFSSIRYIGLFPGIWEDDDPDDWEESSQEYAEAVLMGIRIMPKASALHIQSAAQVMIEILAELPAGKIRELKIDTEWYGLTEGFSTTEMLQQLSSLEELAVLHLPCFSRSQDCSQQMIGISSINWETVRQFVDTTPQLQELAMADMYLKGFQPPDSRLPRIRIPVTWKRGLDLGWEIQHYEWSCSMFKRYTGRYMAHNYFGPYLEEPTFAEWVDNALVDET